MYEERFFTLYFVPLFSFNVIYLFVGRATIKAEDSLVGRQRTIRDDHRYRGGDQQFPRQLCEAPVCRRSLRRLSDDFGTGRDSAGGRQASIGVSSGDEGVVR